MQPFGANPWRGEVTLTLDGRPFALRLSLGALARLETQLQVGTLVELVQRFETGGFSATDILALLAAGLEGGGCEFTASDLAQADIAGGPVAAARAAAELLARSFALPETERAPEERADTAPGSAS